MATTAHRGRPDSRAEELQRLARDRFEPKRYRWELHNDDKGKLVIKVLVDGKLSSEFHEEDAVGR